MEEGVGFHHDLRGIQITGKVQSHRLFAENVCESWHFIGAPSFFARLLELLVNVCWRILLLLFNELHATPKAEPREALKPPSQVRGYFSFRGSLRLFAYGNPVWKSVDSSFALTRTSFPRLET
jgi:hypothetical protein